MTMRKNVASQKFVFTLVNATTGAALTGATVTAKLSIDGGASATASGTVSELANGQYLWSPAQADTNGDVLGVQFTATNAVARSFTIYTGSGAVGTETTTPTIVSAGYLGDFARLDNVTARFDTFGKSGAPITLVGTPSAQVRKGNAAGTTSTADVTLTVDVVTGQHCVDVFLSDAFYATGEEYTVELAAGTVDGVSVAGRVIGSFSIVSRSTANIEANIIAELADLEAKIDTIDNFLDTEIASIISTLAGVPTANQNADALLDRTDAVETAWTPRKVLRIMAAAVAGKVSGSPTAPVFRNITDTKARITATCSLAGDRTVVTLDGD